MQFLVQELRCHSQEQYLHAYYKLTSVGGGAIALIAKILTNYLLIKFDIELNINNYLYLERVMRFHKVIIQCKNCF